MIYPVLIVSKDKKNEFVKFWAEFYDFPVNRNTIEGDYNSLISKIEFDENDIEKLFNWKNNMPIIVRGEDGQEIKKHQHKSKFLDKAKAKLTTINKFKKDFNPDEFNLTFNGSTIWKVFLLHIIDHIKFPIFDQHVYRAYYFLERGNLDGFIELEKISNSQKMKIYKDEYMPFFKDFNNVLLENRKSDKALWAFGKFLKNYPSLFEQLRMV